MTNTTALLLIMFTGFGTVQEDVRQERRFSPTLNDIESQIQEGPGVGQAGMYRSNDRVHHAHEMTHGVNSRLTNCAKQEEGQAYCLYLLNKKVFVFPRSRVTIGEVAAAVPGQWRDFTYRVYLVDSRQWWDKEPHYILDECVAYLHGAKVGLEYGNPSRTEESLENGAKLYRFATIFQQLALCPMVDKYMLWHRNELVGTINKAAGRGWSCAGARAVLASIDINSSPVAQPKAVQEIRRPTPKPMAPGPCPDGLCPTWGQ